MNYVFTFILLIFLQSCSFDNKSGIWKNEKNINKTKKNSLSDFKTLSIKTSPFKETIKLPENFKFKVSKQVKAINWNDIYYDDTNNFDNFFYNNENILLFKSRKISKGKINKDILYNSENLIVSNKKGDLIVYSVKQKKIISKYNFYKKKYKQFKKEINFIVEKNIIYSSDNLGFLYAYNFVENKILWAKNYKIPFRSNLKISGGKLIAANQNNNLFFFDKKDGKILKSVPTEEINLKNEFKNNLLLNNKFLYFLNNYGSLYSLDTQSMNLQWFLNLNQSPDINSSNLFFSTQMINFKNYLVISTNNYLYVINSTNGSILYKKNFTTKIKPLIHNNYLFVITDNNYLISLDLQNGKILYSFNLDQKISEFLNLKKKNAIYRDLMIADDKLLIFLENSYIIKLELNGKIEFIDRLPTKLYSSPIFSNGLLLFLDSKNKLSVVN